MAGIVESLGKDLGKLSLAVIIGGIIVGFTFAAGQALFNATFPAKAV